MSVIFTVQTEKDELETAGHNYHQSKKHEGASMLRKDNNIQLVEEVLRKCSKQLRISRTKKIKALTRKR